MKLKHFLILDLLFIILIFVFNTDAFFEFDSPIFILLFLVSLIGTIISIFIKIKRWIAKKRITHVQKNFEKKDIKPDIFTERVSYRQNKSINIRKIGFVEGLNCESVNPLCLIDQIEGNVESLLSKDFSCGKREETIRIDLIKFFQNIESSNIPLMAEVRVEQLKDECEKRLKAYSRIEEVDKLDGHQFESFCASLLERNGFTDVKVTKGSGDHGVDVLAQKEEIHYAIQCKRYDSDLGNKPIQEVYAGKEFYNCQVGVVMTNQHFTQGAKEMSNATRVLLWDREKLIELMKN